MIVGICCISKENNMAFAKHKKASQKVHQSNASTQTMLCQFSGGIGLGTGNGLLAGIGAGIGGPGGLNL